MKKITTLLICFICSVAFAQPTNNAPTPPSRNPGDVISIFGDAYTNISGINYNPFWGQSGSVNTSYDPGTGNLVLAYTNFNYQGTDFASNPQNASAMEYLHIDIWTSNATVVKVSPIDNSGSGAPETLVSIPLVSGGWSSVDLPKAAFTGMSWNSVFQLKFDGQAGVSPSNIYLDNIYFWKTAVAAGNDATLSDLKVDGTTLPSFNPSAFTYNYGIPGGSAVPQITSTTKSDPNATVTSIVQATAVPGTATVLVTAANGSTTATYTINYFYNSPSTAAPDPTSTNVISLFSDVYTNVNVDTWNTGWSQSGYEQTTIQGNNTKRYFNLGFNGIEATSSPINAGTMTYLHIDVWTPNITTLGIKLVSFLGDGFQGANGDTEAQLNIPLSSGGWNQLHIPLADFTAAGMTSLNDINQFILVSTPFGSGILFVDNFYFTTNPLTNDTPMTAAPTPTHTNVISLFSNAYTNVNVDTWNTVWSQSGYEQTTIQGNDTKRYFNLGFNGIETTTTPVNANGMTYLHLDVWTPNITTLGVKLVSFLGDGFQGANGDTEAQINVPLTSGSWNQLHIPLADFTAAGMTSLNDINQYILVSTPFGSGTLFVDNVYFTTNALSANEFTTSTTLAIAPNPIGQGENLQVSENFEAVTVYAINGQKIKKVTESTAITADLQTGIYFLQFEMENGTTQIKKLIVR